MEQVILDYLKNCDPITIVVVLAGTWLFCRNVKTDLKKDIDEIKTEIKAIHKENRFFNTRLSRTEGTVYGRNIYGATPHEKEMD